MITPFLQSFIIKIHSMFCSYFLMSLTGYVYIRRSRDGSAIWRWMCACVRVYQILASFSSLWAAAHKRIVNIMKVYIERNNMQVELIRFRKKYRLYSRLFLQSEEFSDQRNVYAARSMDLYDRQIVLRD